MKALARRLFVSRRGSLKLILLAVWMCVIKLLSALVFHSPKASIYDISFGFGGYVESILTDGRYVNCIDGACLEAARMPGQPFFLAAIGLITTNLLAAAIIKSLLMSALVIVVFVYLVRIQVGSDLRKTGVWFFVGLALTMSPIVVKHASTVHYEEAFLIELLFLWTFAFLVAVRQIASRAAERNHGVMVLALVLSATAYLFKSSMITVFVLTLALAALWWFGARSRAVLITAVACLVPMAAWGVHNQVATGQLSVMTSFDGQNAYRGLNAQGPEIYPELYLDRLFDSEEVYLSDGTRVELPELPERSEFDDEWAYDEHFRTEAFDWLADNPGDALSFTGQKVWNYFGGVTRTPITYEADARDLPTSGEDLATIAWLLLGRLMWVAMLVLMVVLWRTRDRAARWMVLSVVGINGAYSAPYLVGFNYERHVTTYLVIVAACLGVLAIELLHRRGDAASAASEPETGEPATA